MLYTRKGDNGKTGTFGCDQKISKSSNITEALGCLDEINSYLGVIKSRNFNYKVLDENTGNIVNRVQNNLFIIQAQVAGADKKISNDEVKNIEEFINSIEAKLPPIKSFLISGANEVSASFDFARTIARRAERRVVAVHEENLSQIDAETLVYLNRLSSFLYALARYAANENGVEVAPKY